MRGIHFGEPAADPALENLQRNLLLGFQNFVQSLSRNFRLAATKLGTKKIFYKKS